MKLRFFSLFFCVTVFSSAYSLPAFASIGVSPAMQEIEVDGDAVQARDITILRSTNNDATQKYQLSVVLPKEIESDTDNAVPPITVKDSELVFLSGEFEKTTTIEVNGSSIPDGTHTISFVVQLIDDIKKTSDESEGGSMSANIAEGISSNIVIQMKNSTLKKAEKKFEVSDLIEEVGGIVQEPGKNKYIFLKIAIGLLVLIGLFCGGWWLFKRKRQKQKNTIKKDIATVEVEIQQAKKEEVSTTVVHKKDQ